MAGVARSHALPRFRGVGATIRGKNAFPVQLGVLGLISALALLGGVSSPVLVATASSKAEISPTQTTASWFSVESCQFNRDSRCPMANGRSLYDQEKTQPFFAASWDYKLGTHLTVCRADRRDRRHCVQSVVTDRGPAKRLVRQGRRLDLSKKSFEAVCGDLAQGTCQVSVEPIP